MARKDGNELLQCLAFAHFASHGNRTDADHVRLWEDSFQPYVADEDIAQKNGSVLKKGTIVPQKDFPSIPNRRSVRRRTLNEMGEALRAAYERHLSKEFDYIFLVKLFSHRTTFKDKKTGTPRASVNPKLKITYDIAKTFIKSSFITDLSEYEFLDQNDEFCVKVKDESLKKILDIFKGCFVGRSNYQVLSPVDVFCVKRSMKDHIMRDFETHIINATEDTILSNMSYGTTGKNTYRTLSGKYFHSRDCIGLSLKLSKNIKDIKHVRIVGSITVAPLLRDFVDPYGKLIGKMLEKNADIEKLIDKAITIDFSRFDISTNKLNWKYPVVFNYDTMIDEHTNKPLFNTSVHLNLYSLGNNGFNGQWVMSGKETPYVGGAGVGPSENVMVQYREYQQVIDELVKIRSGVLHAMFPPRQIPSMRLGDYHAALKMIQERKILVKGDMRVIDKFLGERATEYRLGVIRELTKLMKRNFEMVNPKLTDAHMVSAQLSFFLFRGQSKINLSLKKRIFLSIFGIITKSGYKIFERNEGKTEMRNYIKKQFIDKKRDVEAYYSAAPYVVLS